MRGEANLEESIGHLLERYFTTFTNPFGDTTNPKASYIVIGQRTDQSHTPVMDGVALC